MVLVDNPAIAADMVRALATIDELHVYSAASAPTAASGAVPGYVSQCVVFDGR